MQSDKKLIFVSRLSVQLYIFFKKHQTNVLIL
jgi:hypothetical protein